MYEVKVKKVEVRVTEDENKEILVLAYDKTGRVVGWAKPALTRDPSVPATLGPTLKIRVAPEVLAFFKTLFD